MIDFKKLRTEAGLTQKELAEKSGISTLTISRAEHGLPIRDMTREALFAVLVKKEPPVLVLVPPTPPAPEPPADPLLEAMKNLVVELRRAMSYEVTGALEQALLSRRVDPLTNYIPPVDSTPPDLTPDDDVKNHGLAAVAIRGGNPWKIMYHRRFIKDLEKSGGIKGIVISAIQKLAEHGEVYSGIGFKKAELLRNAPEKYAGAEYLFRANRRWRILCRKDAEDKTYVITRIVHHDEIQGKGVG